MKRSEFWVALRLPLFAALAFHFSTKPSHQHFDYTVLFALALIVVSDFWKLGHGGFSFRRPLERSGGMEAPGVGIRAIRYCKRTYSPIRNFILVIAGFMLMICSLKTAEASVRYKAAR
jgi:hypothetical protein